LGTKASEGRGFLDVVTLRQVLVLRKKGMREGDIEEALGLRTGVVAALGRKGIVDIVDE
jgi:hypothetical protein